MLIYLHKRIIMIRFEKKHMTNSNSKIASRRQHNPASSIPQVMKNIPEGLKATNKCKLYIVFTNSFHNKGKSIDIFHGVQLKNVNKLLSKRNISNQSAAFFTIKGNPDISAIKPESRTRTFKIFN